MSVWCSVILASLIRKYSIYWVLYIELRSKYILPIALQISSTCMWSHVLEWTNFLTAMNIEANKHDKREKVLKIASKIHWYQSKSGCWLLNSLNQVFWWLNLIIIHIRYSQHLFSPDFSIKILSDKKNSQ